MALLDQMFNPQTYQGQAGGLLDMLRLAQQAQAVKPGNFAPADPAALPPAAQPTQGQMPMNILPPQNAQPNMQQAPMPQRPAGGLAAGFEGFVNNLHTGPIGAVFGGIGSAMGMGAGKREETARALVANGIEPQMALVLAREPDLLRSVLPRMAGFGVQSSDIMEYEYARRQGFQGGFDQWMQRKRQGAGEYSLTPVYGTDAQGNTVLIQPGKSGEAIQTKLPDGVKISSGVEKVDLGTEWGLYDKRTGSMIGRQPKDIRGAEQAKVEGRGQGEAAESLTSIQSKMPGLEKVVSELDDLSNKATYTLTGRVIDAGMRQAGMEPREAAVARSRYTAMVDNQVLPLLRDTFGAQFTQAEGQTLRETLGDPNKSPAEKQSVLRAFIEQKRRDVDALRSRVSPGQPTAAPAQNDPLGLRR